MDGERGRVGLDAAPLELLGLHEAGWWALVERFEAVLELVALALGGFSLLAVALALVEWAAGRRAARVPAAVASAPVSAPSAAAMPSRRRARIRTRARVRLASRVACPLRAATLHAGQHTVLVAGPIRAVAGAGT